MSRRRRRSKRSRTRRRWVFVFICLALLFSSGAGALAWRINQSATKIHHVSTPAPVLQGDKLGGDPGSSIDTGPAQAFLAETATDDEGTGTSEPGLSAVSTPATVSQTRATDSGDAPDSFTILLMGVDAREGEGIDIGVRPDSLAVARINQETGACRLLSIPRDSRVELPGYGLTKVNHALAVGGIPYQQRVVERFLGIEIDHYGLVDFSGVEAIVDAAGGIEITVTEAFSVGGETFHTGEMSLNGSQALLYARYRGGPDGDFGRIARQQQVLRALLAKAGESNLVMLIPKTLPVLEDHIRTDLDMAELLDLATTLKSKCTPDTFESKALEGSIATFPDPLIGLNLSYVIIDEADARAKIAWLMEI